MKEQGTIVNNLHQRAMELADEAFYAKRREEFDKAQAKYLEAFEYEKGAAMLLVNNLSQEPTRSVFFRSAASLLLNLPYPEQTHFRDAERMIAFGLSGNPPAEIAAELREIWQELIGLLQQEAA